MLFAALMPWGSATPELRYAATALLCHDGLAFMFENPPPLVMIAGTAPPTEHATSLPFPAQYGELQKLEGDAPARRLPPPLSCVAPTASTYGDVAGQSGTMPPLHAPPQPVAPSSPEATTTVIPAAPSAAKHVSDAAK